MEFLYKYLFLFSLPFYIIGCANFYRNYTLNKRIIVVADNNKCEYINQIKTLSPPNFKEEQDAPLSAVFRLKMYSNLNSKEGNSLYQLRMTDKVFPIAEANLYKCPKEVFDKFKDLQNDKDFIYSNIKFDLPKTTDSNE